MSIIKIKSNCIIPSAAYSVPNSKIKFYDTAHKKSPEIGDFQKHNTPPELLLCFILDESFFWGYFPPQNKDF